MRSSASQQYRRARNFATFLLLGAAFALPLPVLAQQAPPTRDDLEVGREDPRGPGASSLSVEGDIERGPCPLADPAFADTRVTFSAVEFGGLPGVPASALDSAWREFAGRELPIAALCDVRDRAATTLRNMGYLAAVQVPPQRIEAGGTVRMDVLAARLVEVQLRGDAGNSEELIAAHLERLTERPFFNTREAERHLLLLEDLPGYDVRLVLRPAGTEPGAVVGDVVIARRQFELIAGAQNLGSRSTGREGGFVALTVNDVFGLGDRTTVSVYGTFDWEEQRIFTISHDIALGADGLRFGGSLLVGHSEPDLGGAPFATDTIAGEAHFSYPLLRRQTQSLFATGGLEAVNQELEFGTTLLSRDKLRTLFARLDYQLVDPDSVLGRGAFTAREPRWRAGLSLDLRQGIEGLGASDECVPVAVCRAPNVPISNLVADPSSLVARLEGSLEFRPIPQFTVAVSPLAQISDGPLLAYEQVSLGNYTIGRGFDPGVALGDHALGGSLELRYGSLFPRRANSLALEPFVFLDYAKAWAHEDAGAPDPHYVLSAGGGVRARWSDWADASVVLAVPLERAGFLAERPDPRLLFTITTRLLPWGDR